MANSRNRIFVLDVDGVIVDSTEECMIIAWNAYHKYLGVENNINSPENADKEYAKKFRSIRNYIRSMDEYLSVFHAKHEEIKSQNDFERIVSSLNYDDRIRYSKYFISARNKFKKDNKIKWLGLHKFYPGIKKFLMNVNDKYPLYIVTGKDRESVMDFLEMFSVNIPNSHIYDRNAAKNKLAALKQIALKENVIHSEIIFVDDNVTHLLSPMAQGFRVYLAGWGYGLPEHFQIAKDCNVPVVSVDDMIALLL